MLFRSIAENEFEFLLQAIEFLAEHGAKFLSLYKLDWHSGAWKHTADQAHPSLFDSIGFDQPTLTRDENTEPDFMGYLEFARTLANQLETRAQSIPPEMIPAELEAELVYFRV